MISSVPADYVKKMEKIKIIKKQKIEKLDKARIKPVPGLLLSYTYFLNTQHTCYISVGYDVETLKLKIILYKNMIYQELKLEDWNLLYKNLTTIQNFFVNNVKEFIINQDGIIEVDEYANNVIAYKLISLKQKNCLMFETKSTKIIIDDSEWKKLYMLSHFLNSISIWCNLVWKEIEQYYHIYYDKCNLLNVDELPASEFFIPTPASYNSCNFSRLFNEISFLCRDKIRRDRSTLQLNKNK